MFEEKIINVREKTKYGEKLFLEFGDKLAIAKESIINYR